MEGYTFEEEDFDLTEYLNNVLGGIDSSSGDAEPTTSDYNKAIKALILRLQYGMEDTNVQLEEFMGQVLLATPGLEREMLRIERESKTLKDQMKDVVSEISSFDSNDSVVVDHLLRLDIVKQNMENCKSKISKSASWNKNVRALEAAIEEQELKTAAEKYVILKDSIGMLADLPRAEERQNAMSSLQNRLQEALVPSVKGALNDDSTERFKYFVKVHELLGAEMELVEMYAKNCASTLRVQWDIYDKHAGFNHWLQKFYESTLKALHTEARRSSTLFPKHVLPVFARVIVGLFEPLAGTFRSRLEKNYSDDLFLSVVSLTMSFLSALELLLASISEKAKKSGNLRLTSLAAMDTEMELALLTIVEPIEEKFERYEDSAIAELLNRFGTISNSKDEFSSLSTEWEISQYLREVKLVMPSLVGQTRTFLEQCVRLTGGTASVELSNAVDAAILKFFSLVSTVRAKIHDLVLNCFGKNGSSGSGEDEDEVHGSDSAQFFNLLDLSVRLFEFSCFIYSRWILSQDELGSALVESIKKVLGTFQGENHRRILGRKPSIAGEEKTSMRSGGRYLKQDEKQVEEISAVLAQYRLRKSNHLRKRLSEYLVRVSEDGISPFEGSVATLKDHVTNSLKLLYTLSLESIRAHLEGIPSMPEWAAVDDDDGGDEDGGDGYDFSLANGPQEYATVVGEGMLSLVQRLGQYSELTPSESGIVLPKDIVELAKEDWDVLLTELGWRNTNFSFQFLESSVKSTGAKEDGDEESPYVDAWSTTIALGAISMLANNILRIDYISAKGAKQLAQDIDYIMNVLSALGMEIGFLIEPFHDLLGKTDEELATLASFNDSGGEVPEELCSDHGLPLHKLARRLAKARGVMTTAF
jgi:conserved oligomeric Golgi complex subunit 7|eukprot:g2743.t1